MPMIRLWWRRLDPYFQAAIILYATLVIAGAVAILMYGCTLNITISDTAPGLEVPADQQSPTKNM